MPERRVNRPIVAARAAHRRQATAVVPEPAKLEAVCAVAVVAAAVVAAAAVASNQESA